MLINMCVSILKAFAFIDSRQNAMLIYSTINHRALTACMIVILDGNPHNSFWMKEPYSILVRLYDKGFRTEAPLTLEYIGSALTEMERQLEARAQGVAFVEGLRQHQRGTQLRTETRSNDDATSNTTVFDRNQDSTQREETFERLSRSPLPAVQLELRTAEASQSVSVMERASAGLSWQQQYDLYVPLDTPIPRDLSTMLAPHSDFPSTSMSALTASCPPSNAKADLYPDPSFVCHLDQSRYPTPGGDRHDWRPYERESDVADTTLHRENSIYYN